MKTFEPKITTSVGLTADMHERLSQEARALNVSQGDVLRAALGASFNRPVSSPLTTRENNNV